MENFSTSNNLIKRSAKSNLYIRSIAVAVFFILIIINERNKYGTGGYVDEIIGVASFAFLLLQRKYVNRNDLINILLLGLVTAIGIISNILSGINENLFSIGVDIVASTKVVFAYIGMKYFSTNEEKQETINMLLPLAKLFTIGACIFSILSQFIDLGMTGEPRYGLKSFNFFFPLNFQYITIMMLALGIFVFTNKLTRKKRLFYYILTIPSLLLALKSSALILAMLFVLLSFYYKKRQKLSPIMIIMILLLLVFMGRYQIENYLLREDVPRHLFWVYGARTANHYFPFGAGFATFGSNEAVVHYSPLYYQYGFDKVWGMSPDFGPFLSDNFWPMAVGQFGWFGALMYLFVYIRIFFDIISTKNLTPQKKAFLFAAYIQYIVAAVGSAILSSSAGIIGFMALAIFTTSDIKKDKKSDIMKINFHIR